MFFVDDNFAINVQAHQVACCATSSRRARRLSWVGQISANLLRDEELVDLIADSGGKWIFIGMESLDPANLASVNKGFNKPSEYAGVLEPLARRNVYAITSFIFGLDHDTPGRGRSARWTRFAEWPPVLPVFGQITPFPATPLYDRLEKEGRLTRPKHWLDFAPFQMAHTPLNMSVPEVQAEVRTPGRTPTARPPLEQALDSLARRPGALQDQPLRRADCSSAGSTSRRKALGAG